MKALHFLYTLVIITFSIGTQAQPDSSVSREKVQFKLGIYYNSTLNYYGRTGSLKSSGFFPLAELWFGKNFYVNAAPVFINNSLTRFEYAGTVATAGYQFNRKQKFSGHMYVVKPIYRHNSDLVQSALEAQFAATFTWLNKILNVTAGGDIKWSDQADFGVMASLDHIFRFKGGRRTNFVLDPSVTVNAGTQRFVQTHYKKTGNFLILPGVEQEVTTTSHAFNVLSYELSMPVIMAKGKFQWLINPAYVVPQNLVTIDNRPDLSESGKKMLYITAGVKIKF
jgi:hypothetical protein